MLLECLKNGGTFGTQLSVIEWIGVGVGDCWMLLLFYSTSAALKVKASNWCSINVMSDGRWDEQQPWNIVDCGDTSLFRAL